jgi:hypothetical protein
MSALQGDADYWGTKASNGGAEATSWTIGGIFSCWTDTTTILY